MIHFVFYRWIRTLLGARSFKRVASNRSSYVLVNGSHAPKLTDALIEMGFTEE